MGASMSSAEYRAVQLVPQSNFVAIDRKFTAPRVVTLDMKGQIWTWSGQDFLIRDADTGDVYFRIDAKAFSLRERKILRDYRGNVIAVTKEDLFSFMLTQRVFSSEATDHEILAIKTRLKMGFPELECSVRNLSTGRVHELRCKGDWTSRRAIISIDNGVVIAKLRQPLELGGARYFVDVAPGVDIALVTLVCIAMDEDERHRRN
ncbi:hypothetical protein SPRG_05478 [Saprolegnia parasitica CBS 223.65]|uniref:Tubby C-terminal domain-containing protein n=1 Tax=Saprolegnia parasitica (strain CBS 223.65) TaxID=695850 RepID=A0A067CSK4_SAPPC|nr:hypothetical protein SPRG_05478 [Saprolegnia parasitica CBS 223.65]KDO29521.1 hypothetical protein SPRG_05478 [Saprolegnia parasitica CBS 223.65]|eukprot:XP_012199587.1 hypothetical protein SPRG_05478 [Saprolegnia parasitica CBS 223.65]